MINNYSPFWEGSRKSFCTTCCVWFLRKIFLMLYTLLFISNTFKKSKSQAKNLNILRAKGALKWNKKQFSLFLNGSQLSKIVPDFRVRLKWNKMKSLRTESTVFFCGPSAVMCCYWRQITGGKPTCNVRLDQAWKWKRWEIASRLICLTYLFLLIKKI